MLASVIPVINGLRGRDPELQARLLFKINGEEVEIRVSGEKTC